MMDIMGHRITLVDWDDLDSTISGQEVRDLVQLLYAGADTNFEIISCQMKRFRGQHQYFGLYRVHRIQIDRRNIQSAVERKIHCGGNSIAPNLRMGVGMVLAHELQHANQFLRHKWNEIFFTKKKYISRPSEMEARQFVDNNLDVIAGVLGFRLEHRQTRTPTLGGTKDRLIKLADDLEGSQTLTVKDLVEELRSSRMNNPKNVERLSNILIERGVKITY